MKDYAKSILNKLWTVINDEHLQKITIQSLLAGAYTFYKIRQWCLDKVNVYNPESFRVLTLNHLGSLSVEVPEQARVIRLSACIMKFSKFYLLIMQILMTLLYFVTANTATAAGFNIGGITLHQAFSLSKSLPL